MFTSWEHPSNQEVFNVYHSMLQAPHLLIAGATGTGKSVLINALIHTALTLYSPTECQFILIDPKRVELVDYKHLPHTLSYSTEPQDIIKALAYALVEMERRFKKMQRKGLKKSNDPHIYIIIDEYADLVTLAKKQVEPILKRLAQLGRASNIHLILATQRPTRDIITWQIKVNIDCRVALHCTSPIDSRNIIDTTGAELLPRYGECLYLTPKGIEHTQIELIPQEETKELITHWQKQNNFIFNFMKKLNPL